MRELTCPKVARNRLWAAYALAVVFLLVLGVPGCKNLFAGAGRPKESKQAVTGIVRVSGSGTTVPLLKVLAQDFRDLVPTIRILFLPGVHSGGGIKGAASGSLDIGAISRELKPSEKKLGLRAYKLSSDALAVATNRSVRIRGITSAQLRAIYRGSIRNWRQLGGPNVAIAVLDRNEDESAKIVFRQYVLGRRLKVSPAAVNLFYESDMVDGLLNVHGAVGYFSYGFARANNAKVNLLALDGVVPSVENVKDGSYRMVRVLGIVTTMKPSAPTRVFVEYVTSPRAAAVMSRHGFAPYRR